MARTKDPPAALKRNQPSVTVMPSRGELRVTERMRMVDNAISNCMAEFRAIAYGLGVRFLKRVPSPYSDDFCPLVFKMYEDSMIFCTASLIAATLGISRETYYLWVRHYPRFAQAIEEGKAIQEARTATQLVNCAGSPQGLMFLLRAYHHVTDNIEVTASAESSQQWAAEQNKEWHAKEKSAAEWRAASVQPRKTMTPEEAFEAGRNRVLQEKRKEEAAAAELEAWNRGLQEGKRQVAEGTWAESVMVSLPKAVIEPKPPVTVVVSPPSLEEVRQEREKRQQERKEQEVLERCARETKAQQRIEQEVLERQEGEAKAKQKAIIESMPVYEWSALTANPDWLGLPTDEREKRCCEWIEKERVAAEAAQIAEKTTSITIE